MLNTLPDLHRSFAEQLKLKLQSDSRIHLLAGGSFIHGGFDQYPIWISWWWSTLSIMTKSWLSVWRSPERSAICYMLSPGTRR